MCALYIQDLTNEWNCITWLWGIFINLLRQWLPYMKIADCMQLAKVACNDWVWALSKQYCFESIAKKHQNKQAELQRFKDWLGFPPKKIDAIFCQEIGIRTRTCQKLNSDMMSNVWSATCRVANTKFQSHNATSQLSRYVQNKLRQNVIKRDRELEGARGSQLWG